jgi:hypothetical protein
MSPGTNREIAFVHRTTGRSGSSDETSPREWGFRYCRIFRCVLVYVRDDCQTARPHRSLTLPGVAVVITAINLIINFGAAEPGQAPRGVRAMLVRRERRA